MAPEPLSVCVPAALPAEGELRGGESSPAEPDPAAESAEPDAPRAEHGEQGAVPRGAEAVHVSGLWLWQAARPPGADAVLTQTPDAPSPPPAIHLSLSGQNRP